MFEATLIVIVAVLYCGFLLGAALLYDGLRGLYRGLTCQENEEE